MNRIILLTLTLALIISSNLVSNAFATGQAAGLPCQAPPSGAIETTSSDAKDDLLACVGGTWHSMIYGNLPSGGIAAFQLSSCPSGWTDVPALAGRTIIGVGTGMAVGTGALLTPRALDDFGGEELHTMTLNELVPHTITMSFGVSDKGGRGNGYALSDNAGGSTILGYYNKTSDTVGGGVPFNVMMPYYALLYCMKQ